MKPINRFLIMLGLVLVVTALLGTDGPTPDAGASPQEASEAEQSTTEEPLPEFQPSERLPADSAVAFPTDI